MTEERTVPAGESGDRDSAPDQEADTRNIHHFGVDYHPGRLDAALRYVEKGLAVFPLRPGTKVPYPRSHGHLDATLDDGELLDTWPAPNANVAVATGSVSGVWVLDVDPRHGGVGSLIQVLIDYADAECLGDHPDGATDREILLHYWQVLPNTTVTLTPGGGMHLWWAAPKFNIRSGTSVLGSGLDVKGEGGYVVVPPSRTPEGAYRWTTIRGPRSGFAPAPEWLLDLLRQEERDGSYAEPIVGTIGGGQRNVSLTSLAGTMRDRGCEGEEIYALLTIANARRCDPPLPEREVEAIVRSVLRYPPGKAWWAVGEAEDAAADDWLTDVQDEAARRWAGAR